MMEHVGPKNHRDMMKVIDRCLVDDGVALVHTIAQQPQPAPRHAVHREVHLPERGRAVARAARPRDGGPVRPRGPPQHRPGLRSDADGVVGQLRSHATARSRTATTARFYQMWKFYLLAAAGACARARRPALPGRDDQDRPRAARLPVRLSRYAASLPTRPARTSIGSEASRSQPLAMNLAASTSAYRYGTLR